MALITSNLTAHEMALITSNLTAMQLISDERDTPTIWLGRAAPRRSVSLAHSCIRDYP